ncbi:hypothetical protein [Ktedonospora formicarum]|uniref:Uncharacterized protein n=1 Tax=Ktedonospora formicarum TaxID=2778364 RepID=A0A8J3MWV9_9CHLR|nr:hypothetical protein [Ktedonospora formicarum]GHO50770.1 hypothetical protein KSX_89330 [Ktedonospora formicarum]
MTPEEQEALEDAQYAKQVWDALGDEETLDIKFSDNKVKAANRALREVNAGYHLVVVTKAGERTVAFHDGDGG